MSPQDPFNSGGVFLPYRYTPTLVAPVIFAVVFFLLATAHTYQVVRSKTWYFIPLVVGAYSEVGGYIARCFSHEDMFAIAPFTVYGTLSVLAPAFFAASIYIILGRLIRQINAEHLSVIRVNWLTRIFVTGDVFSLILQAAGVGIMNGGSLDIFHAGEHVVVAGLLLQTVLFAFFVAVALIFHRRILKHPTPESRALLERGGRHTWRYLLWVLYTVSALILVRSIFRAIEYAQGNDGYLLTHEIYTYFFDALLMTIVLVVFNVYHPSKVIPGGPVAVKEKFESEESVV